MPDVTLLLNGAISGDQQSAAALLPLVYEELRRLAGTRMDHEATGHTLDATGLVHEVYLRLVGDVDLPKWAGRAHFFAVAAEMMGRILIDHALRKNTTAGPQCRQLTLMSCRRVQPTACTRQTLRSKPPRTRERRLEFATSEA